MAIYLSTKVFCTSNASFTARFNKTIIMPVGVDTALFKAIDGISRKKYSISMIGRIAPIKRIDLGLKALHSLISSGKQGTLHIVGKALPKDFNYMNSLNKYVEEKNLSRYVYFLDAVSPPKLPEVYSSYEICLNLTEDGSFDKTIVESSSCGAIPLVSNKSLVNLLPESCITEPSPESISKSIQKVLDAHQKLEIQEKLKLFVQSQSLTLLMEKLFKEMK